MPQAAQVASVPISPEVLAFAAERGVSAYLPAVLAMTQRLFPDARRMAILIEQDPEIASNRSLVIEVDVTGLDADGYAEANWRWGHELFQLCPAPLVCEIGLYLDIVEP